MHMGADLSNIEIVTQAKPANGKPRPFNPATDMTGLAAKAGAIGGVTLLMLDPIVAAIPSTKNSHNNAETRNGLQPVVDFAEAANCAVLGVTHFTKGTAGKDPVERVTGSLAFGALPRIIFASHYRKAPNLPKWHLGALAYLPNPFGILANSKLLLLLVLAISPRETTPRVSHK
jgi:putative DNA primase/helicase